MATLNTMPLIQAALGKIASKGTIQYDNGTFGKTVRCYLWDVETSLNEEAKKLMESITMKKLTEVDYSDDAAKLQKMEAVERNTLVFRLVEPMLVKGTKILVFNQKALSPEIKSCNEFYVPQEIANQSLITYEETEDIETNSQGQDTPVLELKFVGCILDVKEGQRDFFKPSVWRKAPRAYLTDVSFRSMQIVGKLMNTENQMKRKAMNFISDDELNTI